MSGAKSPQRTQPTMCSDDRWWLWPDDDGEAEVVRVAPGQPMGIHHGQPHISQYADVRTEQDERDQSEDEPEEREIPHARAGIADRMRPSRGIMP